MAVGVLKTMAVLTVLLCVGSYAQTPHAQKALSSGEQTAGVRTFLIRQVSSDLQELKKTIDSCAKKVLSRGAVPVEDMTLGNMGFDTDVLIKAISHLYFHNLFECERSARERLAFSLGTLRRVNAGDRALPENIERINADLLHPTKEQLEYAAQYATLPKPARKMLEQRIGDSPFKLMGTLEKIHRLNDP